jgi:type 2A phosphatase activator TIP41
MKFHNKMAESSGSGPGTQSAVSKNGAWKLTTRKLPILKAEPIEELHQKIGIPIPEMIFGDNFVSVTHCSSTRAMLWIV